jgi:transposase
MTVSPFVEADIARLHYAEHFKVGTIASQLGVHADVVRRVLGLVPEPSAERKPRVLTLAPYVGFIQETLQKYPDLRSTRLYDMLCERNYKGSPRTVRHYVRTVRPKIAAQVFLRTHPLPAEQAQIDWGYVGKVRVHGGQRALWVFVMVLAYSRALWAELVYDLSVHSLRRSLCRAALHFGGCTRQWLFDNPKTVVLERHQDQARFQPLLLDLCGALRVQPRLCSVRAPWQKGRVERAVRYLKDRFFAGRTISGIDAGNQQLTDFLARIPPERPHPLFQDRTVAQVFAEEQKLLLELPDCMPDTDQVLSVVPDKTAFVRFDRNLYSVPPAFAKKSLTLCASDTLLRFLEGGTLVAEFTRSDSINGIKENPAHREELLKLKQRARAPKARDRLRLAVPECDALFTQWLLSGKNVGSLTLRTLKLLDLYGQDLLQAAVQDALARDTCDLSALSLLCEYHRPKKARPLPVDIPLGDHVPEHDVIPHPLEHYDAK